ncbi:hypothetical protein TNCV_4812951 [Trichonephila clavipes]|nr:hypothetical protein TNCV_4812951 [Trichonephila clavipes]
MQVTVRFFSVPPQFRGRKPWGWSGPPTYLPLPPITREDLRLDGYLEYSHAAKALNIYKHPCLLRDSNTSYQVITFHTPRILRVSAGYGTRNRRSSGIIRQSYKYFENSISDSCSPSRTTPETNFLRSKTFRLSACHGSRSRRPSGIFLQSYGNSSDSDCPF